jgi:hypothetical protein
LAEGCFEVVSDLPASGGDFQDIARGVGEIENDFRRKEGIAFKTEALLDWLRGEIAVARAGFECSQCGAEGG